MSDSEEEPFFQKPMMSDETKADIEVLDRILHQKNDPEITAVERRAFHDMRCMLRSGDQEKLTMKQRQWACEVDARTRPIDLSKVPALSGRVPTMPVLAAPLPKRPPGRAS